MKIGNTEYAKLEDVAEQLNVKKNTVKNWIKEHNISVRDFGRTQLIDDDNLGLLLDKREQKVKKSKKKRSEIGKTKGAQRLKKAREKKQEQKEL